ncbi:MAG: hypothetical protein LAO51_11445 [Acidobacteriia bacterium]|nr:hypothetical protein [Terriglobia bacterium]
MRCRRLIRLVTSAAFPMGVLAVLLLLTSSCGGGGGGGGPAIECASSSAGLNQVVMSCGGQSNSTTEVVKVVLGGGATAASDVQGFHFDVVYDPAKIAFVTGSAAEGTFLNKDGDDPLLAVQLANGVQGRVIVGFDRTNQPAGVQGTDVANDVLRLSFTVLGSASVAPVPLTFENAEAVDHTGAGIAAITFHDGLSLSRR